MSQFPLEKNIKNFPAIRFTIHQGSKFYYVDSFHNQVNIYLLNAKSIPYSDSFLTFLLRDNKRQSIYYS